MKRILLVGVGDDVNEDKEFKLRDKQLPLDHFMVERRERSEDFS